MKNYFIFLLLYLNIFELNRVNSLKSQEYFCASLIKHYNHLPINNKRETISDSLIQKYDKQLYQNSIYFSLSGLYIDLESIMEFNIFWLPPIGYCLRWNKSNIIDCNLTYGIRNKVNFYGVEQINHSNIGIKAKLEYKRLFTKKEYIGLCSWIIFNKFYRLENVKNQVNLSDKIDFSRVKIILAPKVGLLISQRLYIDISMGGSINYTIIQLKKHNYLLNMYENQINNKEQAIYCRFYFEFNVGYSF